MHQPARIVCAVALAGLLAVTSCSRSGSGSADDTGSGGTSNSSSTGTLDASFGTTKVACGPNTTGEKLGSPDQGVTADAIHVATISDIGFAARPGLNQELFDASDVFTKWCNDLGGINGRKIVIDKRDAALTNYKTMISDSCTTDLALVGGGGVMDDTGQVARLKCLLPNFGGYVVSAQARDADLTVEAVPFPVNTINVSGFRYVKQNFPGSYDKVAFVYGNVQTLQGVKDQYSEVIKNLDGTIVDSSAYNALGEASWTPFAQNLKSKGVKGLVFVGEPSFMAKLAQAMDSIDYKPDWVLLTANFYDEGLIADAGDSLHNIYIMLVTTPYFDEKNAAMRKYRELFEHYLPNGKKQAVLGQNSFSSWILFAQAASECGAMLTRKCLYDNGHKVTNFDAGGFQAPTDPSTNTPTDCGTLVTVKDKKFTQVDMGTSDGSIWSCDKANLMTLTGNYGKGTTFADAGTSLSDLPG